MHFPPSRSSRATRRGLALAATAAACLGVAAPAAVAATPAQIDAAVARGADYLVAQQAADGRFLGFGGDWTLSSLSAAGRDVDAVRATPEGPSALAAYRTLWTSGPDGEEDWTTPSGPDPFNPTRAASDYARAGLISYAAGLDPRRLAADQNLVAQLAGVYHGRQPGGETAGAGLVEGTFGNPAPMSTVTGSLFLLSRLSAPPVLLDTIAASLRSNQLNDGAWSWDRVSDPSERADSWRGDFDMTGQAIGALCDIGVRPTDPAIVRGLEYIHDAQIASGGITNPYAPDGDVNTTAALVFALNACGIDPQGPEWTTGAGETPIDFLLANQIATGDDAGGFPASYAPGAGNLYASQEAVRALSGSGYVTEPREHRAAPTVADGTVVPQALVVDAGTDETGERDLRVCRVSAPVGATVAELVAAAASSAQPAGCVTGLEVRDGVVQALNGVAGDHPQRTWLARVEGGAARRAGDQPVCFGQIVSLYVGRASDAQSGATTPCTEKAAPVDPTPQPVSPQQPAPAGTTPAPSAAPAPKVAVAGAAGAKSVRLDRKGRVRLTLRCPANAGPRGCSSVIEARSTYRTTPRGEARDRRVGGRAIRVSAGRSRTVTVALSPALRRDLRRVGVRRVRFVIRTQGDDARKPARSVLTVAVRPVARG